MKTPRPPDAGPAEGSPDAIAVGRFASLVLSVERRDLRAAASAQRDLRRLGWSVMQLPPKHSRKPQKGGPDGR